MTQKLTTTLMCDECAKKIADDAPHHEVSYIVRVPDPTVDAAPKPVAVMLHFHDECFDRQTALQAKRIEAVSE